MKTRNQEPEESSPSSRLDQITYAKVFPPIGFARVGDSTEEEGWFIGAEWPGQRLSANPLHRYKDDKGRVKRQAVRFRIYGFDKNHKVVAELTNENAEIVWEVSLANKKASFFRFNGAFSALKHLLDPNHPPAPAGAPDDDLWKLRNDEIGRGTDPSQPIDRNERSRLLEIDGGTQRISRSGGAESEPEPARFKGRFLDKIEVYLGELRTDESGRLIVLGGRGKSGSFDLGGKPNPNNWITHYANNDLWHDDVSDGPVSARVTLKGGHGRDVEVKGGAWVIVTPPDFAPDVSNVVTLLDVFVQTNADQCLQSPELSLYPDGKTLFWRDVFPIFQSMEGYSWLNKMALRGHGVDKPGFFDRRMLLRLADPSQQDEEVLALRRHIISRIRKPWHYLLADADGFLDPATVDQHPDFAKAAVEANAQFMPPLSGDESDRVEGDPTSWLGVTKLQYTHLTRWVENDFEQGEIPAPYRDLETKAPASLMPPLPEQPLALTLSPLQRCNGGGFYPGIEMAAVARRRELFSEAFRIDPEKYCAGDITQHMAVPWQSDFYACRQWWWPSQRPDDVVHEADVKEIAQQFPTDRSEGRLARLLFNRRPWARGVNTKRPNLNFFRVSWLPGRRPRHSREQYYDQVLATLADIWAGRVFRARDANSSANPWRFQYLRQEALDRYNGRYFQAFFASPDEFVIRRLSSYGCEGVSPDAVLRRLRQKWPEIPEELELGNGTTGEFYEAYVQYCREVFLTHADETFKPLLEASGTAEDLEKLLRNLAENGASSSAQRFNEVNAGDLSHARLAFSEVCQGIADLRYLQSLDADLGGYNGMVDHWGELGFVVERTIQFPDETSNQVLVESETSRYDGLEYRDYFNILMNLVDFPDFFDYAVKIVERILGATKKLIDNPELVNPVFGADLVETMFEYSPVTFSARLEEIYEYFRRQGEVMRPWLVNRTRQERIDGLVSLAPFNQCDGAWLRFIADAGPTDEIRSVLFEIWSDETGNGDPALHHGNLYTSKLNALNIFLPDLESMAYARFPAFRDEFFVGPVFELAISLHSKRYFAEILGMTLFLEWEVLDLVAGIKLNDYLGLDTQFLKMHVGIDNAEDGHGAKAKQAVELHLANVLNEGGEAAVQAEWRRIWCGFWAFATAGYDYLLDDAAVLARRRAGIEDRLVSLITEKAEHGQVNHDGKQLARNRINDLFDEPFYFLEKLQSSQWIVPGEPDESRFLSHLTTFSGPMYKIFTPDEMALWQEWVLWLGLEGSTRSVTRYFNKEESMRALFEEIANAAQATQGHQRYGLIDEAGVSKPIGKWFEEAESSGDYRPLMRALVANRWAIPFDADKSPMVVDMLRVDRPMGEALDRRFPDINGQIGRRIIVDWITAGCPVDGKPQGDRPIGKVIPRLERRSIVQVFGKGSIH